MALSMATPPRHPARCRRSKPPGASSPRPPPPSPSAPPGAAPGSPAARSTGAGVDPSPRIATGRGRGAMGPSQIARLPCSMTQKWTAGLQKTACASQTKPGTPPSLIPEAVQGVLSSVCYDRLTHAHVVLMPANTCTHTPKQNVVIKEPDLLRMRASYMYIHIYIYI